ncbi:hypothetical protein AAE478_002357 [Parahypoxylon ruwenzoriense]
MCFEFHQEFSECCHVSTELTKCPTYHKQQGSARGFFGALFRGNIKNRKDCGRVVRHYAELKPFCQKCTIKNERLRTKHVGDGALKVYRPIVEEDFRRPFQEYREKRRQAARRSQERSERHAGHSKEKRNYVVADTVPKVWIPELYHHPQTLARKETYGRAAEAAPPVCPSRPQKSSSRQHSSHKHSRGEKETQAHKKSSKRSHEYSRQGFFDRTPAFGNSQPLTRPAEPAPTHQHRHRRKFADNEPPIPPIHESRRPPPPQPSTTRHGRTAWLQQRADIPLREPPSSASQPFRAPEMATEKVQPTLRRKLGRVHNISVPRGPPVPLPEYQVYLNALNFAADTAKVTKMPRPPAKSNRHVEGGRRRSTLQSLSKIIRIDPPSPGSDVSFVCQSSKQLASMQDPQAGARPW